MHGKLGHIPKNQQFFCHIYQKTPHFPQYFLGFTTKDLILIILPVWTALNPFILISNLLLKLCKEIQEIGTYFMPLRCIMLMMMVALMKNNMKKSTISAKSLWTGDGMLYSRPGRRRRTWAQIYHCYMGFWLCFVLVCKIRMGQIQCCNLFCPASILGMYD